MKKALPYIICVLSIIIVVLLQAFGANDNYYLTCAAVILLSLVPFVFTYERESHSARELALVAALTAIAVAGRAVFYLVPQVKPIGAVVIVSGACLGAKRGYLIGVFSMFISNFIFGQGIWTPFQMAALGAVGLLSGIILNKNSKKIPMALLGFLLTFALYGLIVDLCSVLMLTSDYSIASILAVYAAGVPTSLVFGASTAVFLFFFGEPFMRKINRITVKYGILQ